MEAYSYIRFSHPDQKEGVSVERQLELHQKKINCDSTKKAMDAREIAIEGDKEDLNAANGEGEIRLAAEV